MNLPVQLRQRRNHGMLQPESAAHHRGRGANDQEQDEDNYREKNWMSAALFHFNISTKRHLEDIVSLQARANIALARQNASHACATSMLRFRQHSIVILSHAKNLGETDSSGERCDFHLDKGAPHLAFEMWDKQS